MTSLKMHRDGVRAWRLVDAVSGVDVGGIRFEHAGDGNHYQPWLLVDGAPRDFGERLPQLAIAARAVDAARASGRKT
jgi:hypothetical protein